MNSLIERIRQFGYGALWLLYLPMWLIEFGGRLPNYGSSALYFLSLLVISAAESIYLRILLRQRPVGQKRIRLVIMLLIAALLSLLSLIIWAWSSSSSIPSLAIWNGFLVVLILALMVKSFRQGVQTIPSEEDMSLAPEMANHRKKERASLVVASLSVASMICALVIFSPEVVHVDCFTEAEIVTWHDLNGDGLRDPGEPGLANIEFGILSQDGDLLGFSSERTSREGVGMFFAFISCSGDRARSVGAVPRPAYALTTDHECFSSTEGATCEFGFVSTCVATEDYLRAFHPKGFFHEDNLKDETAWIGINRLGRSELDSDDYGRIFEVQNNYGCVEQASAITVERDDSSEEDATRNADLLALVAHQGLTPHQVESVQTWMESSLGSSIDEAIAVGSAEATVQLSQPEEYPVMEFSLEYYDNLAITRLSIKFQD